MRKKLTLQILFTTLSILVLSSCWRRSVLSDVEITDPSILDVRIELTESYNELMKSVNNGMESSIRVNLYDKHNDLVALKNGSVMVNNIEMDQYELYITEGIVYGVEPEVLSIKPDKLYEFSVNLPNGKSYHASIQTPKHKGFNLTLPEKLNPNTDLLVKWKAFEADSNDKVILVLSGSYGPDSLYNVSSDEFELSSKDCSKGEYLIPKSYFNVYKDINNIDVELKFTKEGEISNAFDSHSKITYTYSDKRNCKVHVRTKYKGTISNLKDSTNVDM